MRCYRVVSLENRQQGTGLVARRSAIAVSYWMRSLRDAPISRSTGIDDCHLVMLYDALMAQNEKLLDPEVPYLSAIGGLMYLANTTRTDIAFSVDLLARSIMARALVQSTSIPSSVAGERTTKFNEFGKTKRTVTMLWNAQSSSLRLRDFTGLRGCNAIDTLVRSGQTLQSKVAAATSARRPRGCRSVPKAMFERFTEKAIKVIMLAQEEARRLGHNFVGTEQILLGLIGEGTGIAAKVLKSMGINLKDARVEVEKIIGRGSGFVAVEIPFTPRAKRVLELSLEEARQLGHNYIGSEHLLLGLLREGEGVAARVLENLGADPSNIRTQASSRSHMLPLGSLIVIRMVGESNEAVGASVGGGTSGQKMPTLEEYGTNLTKLAEEGKLDPVVGRQPQIERVTQILGRRTKNNPCLIGEPGVGKTAIAEGLAQRIANGDVPETIEGKKVITLDMGLLVAGTKYRGEFEERLKKLMEEIKQSDEIILFIDEVHTLIGAGAAEGAIDAANILKPALARGELQVSYPPCLVLPVLFFLEIKNENYEYFCPKLLGLGCGCRTRVRIRVSDPS
ncbi:Chaperone protein ClpC1, chloroplastic [Capsicum annuum]|nr:Chaperone protein ClpC1, chloroplastic [Capsicum annuum]KAF3646942.1 Chaperone protein ClpC1, chloroplastic [Capsicum annuum]